MNRLTDLLGIEKPIFQAPIGSMAGPELCAAVSGAGGLGSLGVSWTSEADLVQKIKSVKQLTANPFQINYVLHFDVETIEAALEAGVKIVTFSFGDPAPYLALVRSSGAKVGVQVGSVKGAVAAAELGVDFLILQGTEAGGHVQAHDLLSKTLPQVVRLCPETPLAVAGGLSTHEDVKRVLADGADAAVFGSRFVACQESEAHDDYKRTLVEARAEDTVLTMCFDGGWPGTRSRVVRNSVYQAWEAAGCPNVGRRPKEGETVARNADGSEIPTYYMAAPRHDVEGDIEAMCHYAGTSVEQIDDSPTAAELVERLWP